MQQEEDRYTEKERTRERERALKLQDMILQYTVQGEESLWSKFII